ncbi:MAG: hypothetical protein WC545_01130 [Patescibacteria group bacterium]
MSEENNKENNQANEAEVKEDFLIRNMPAAERLSGRFLNPDALKSGGGSGVSNVSQSSVSAKHNFKAVGLIIIVGGLIVIGFLIFLVYRFIISPAARPATQEVPSAAIEEKAVEEPLEAPEPEVNLVPEIAEVDTAEPVIMEPDVENEAGAEEEIIMNEETPLKTAMDLPPLLDSDNDGLNDDEEAVFGTALDLSDSDNDGYDDLAEIKNNYNPAGEGRLENNSALEIYIGSNPAYQLLYPKNWPVLDAGDGLTIFTAPDDSLIQISVQDNPTGANILNWYESYFSGETVSYDRLKSGETWEGIAGPDGFNFYLTDKNQKNIFIISYISSASGRMTYANILEMMINSLMIE